MLRSVHPRVVVYRFRQVVDPEQLRDLVARLRAVRDTLERAGA